MSGLIYEVSWVRSLELIFGATTFAVATVLASFMGGLAWGSYSAGRFSSRLHRYHPLLVYAVIEVLIAVVGLTIPLTFRAMIPIYQYVWKLTHASFITFSLIRFFLSALVLVIPTFLMGATLPIVSSFVSSDVALGKKRIGLLYSFNTLGAVLGCVAAGLILFPRIGLMKTQWVAVALNMVAAGGAWFLGSRRNAPAPVNVLAEQRIEQSESTPVSAAIPLPGTRLLIAIFALSGFVAMLYEVAWNRALVLSLGSSTYAYTIMLATFLTGLALGAWLATRFLRASPLISSGLCQFAIALSTLLGVALMDEMPWFYVKLHGMLHPGASGLLNLQFLLAAALMILPTLGLGAMFPITMSGLNSTGPRAARVVGWAYALNTLGAIVGSVAAGFWLVPQLGSQKTLLAGIALNSVCGLAALIGCNASSSAPASPRPRGRRSPLLRKHLLFDACMGSGRPFLRRLSLYSRLRRAQP